MMRCTLLAMCLALTAGCSRFERDWKAALSHARPASRPASIEGPWQGRWQSNAGHGGGELRCLLRPISDNRYEARFRATFWGILKAGYTIELVAGSPPPQVSVRGKQDLGWLAGGVYQYEGTITPDRLQCTYRSKHDHGTFDLSRP